MTNTFIEEKIREVDLLATSNPVWGNVGDFKAFLTTALQEAVEEGKNEGYKERWQEENNYVKDNIEKWKEEGRKEAVMNEGSELWKEDIITQYKEELLVKLPEERQHIKCDIIYGAECVDCEWNKCLVEIKKIL